MKTLIIAEAGINHNRDMNVAVRLVDAASDAGADVVKFQLEVGGDYCPSFEQMRHIYLYCVAKSMKFACTAFDVDSLEYLIEHTQMEFVKVASKCYDKKLLARVGKCGLPMIVSTGNSTLRDVKTTIEDIIGARYEWQHVDMTLLHCVSAYPAPIEATNLRAMDAIKAQFGLPVGMSDHSLGLEIPVAAVARGATVIEKHLTLDRVMPGPDHVCSLEPEEFAAMVMAIRNIELALGDEVKAPQRCEA